MNARNLALLALMCVMGCADANGYVDLGTPLDGGDTGPECEYTPGHAGAAEGATCSENILMACTGGGVFFPIDCDTVFAGQLEAACVETGGFGGCGVIDGESCYVVVGSGDPLLLFCEGVEAGCIFHADGATPTCAQNIGTCDEVAEPHCQADLLAFDCNAAQPAAVDCGEADEAASCVDAAGDDGAHCGGIGLGGPCDADWDGAGDVETAVVRCAPGLECVGETEDARGSCQAP